MIDQTSQLNELPIYWQEQIRKLRSENFELRSRLRAGGIAPLPEMDELPRRWQTKIAKLRTENGKYRTDRKALQAELAAVRAELEARSE